MDPAHQTPAPAAQTIPNTESVSKRRHSRRVHTTSTVFASLIAGLLGFTAFAKFVYPQTKPIVIDGTDLSISGKLFDQSIAGFEVIVLIAALALHRYWGAWLLNAIFFASLAGYSGFKSYHGEACGCAGSLVEFPKFFMAGLDVVIAAASIAMAGWLRAPRVMLPFAAAVAIGAGFGGWTLSNLTTPPKRAETAEKHGGKTAAQRLFESDLLREARESSAAGGPAFLVFCHDPTCHICEAMKPLIDFKLEEYDQTEDPVMRIRQFSIPELESSLKIEQHAWETPTLFLLQNGTVTKLWAGKALEDFTPERLQEIYDTAAAGGYPAPEAPEWTRGEK